MRIRTIVVPKVIFEENWNLVKWDGKEREKEWKGKKKINNTEKVRSRYCTRLVYTFRNRLPFSRRKDERVRENAYALPIYVINGRSFKGQPSLLERFIYVKIFCLWKQRICLYLVKFSSIARTFVHLTDFGKRNDVSLDRRSITIPEVFINILSGIKEKYRGVIVETIERMYFAFVVISNIFISQCVAIRYDIIERYNIQVVSL